MMIHIKDILNENITRKQLNNRVVSLKKNYPNLITGGGRGRGGKYKIHPLLTDFLIRPKLSSNTYSNNFYYPFPEFNSIELFKSINWDWFCCYNPNCNSIDSDSLLKMIPLDDGDICFYSIHETIDDNKLHIHFTIKTNRPKSYLQHYPKIKNNCKVESFEPEQVISCYNYFSNTYFERNNQKLKEFGYLIGNNKI